MKSATNLFARHDAVTQQFSNTNYSEVFAALPTTVLPTIIVYLVFQRYFI